MTEPGLPSERRQQRVRDRLLPGTPFVSDSDASGGLDNRSDVMWTLSDLPHDESGCIGHWMLFNDARQVVGCHCGFVADVEADCGWGDSVVQHLLDVPRR